jgi:hypothetical protein
MPDILSLITSSLSTEGDALHRPLEIFSEKGLILQAGCTPIDQQPWVWGLSGIGGSPHRGSLGTETTTVHGRGSISPEGSGGFDAGALTFRHAVLIFAPKGESYG